MTKTKRIKKTTIFFSPNFYWSVLGLLLLSSGLHTSFYLLLTHFKINVILTVHLVLLFHITCAYLITLYIKQKIDNLYEKPVNDILFTLEGLSKGENIEPLSPMHELSQSNWIDLIIHNLNLVIKEVESLEALKIGTIADISHELKTPIAVISNYALLLEENNLPEGKRLEYSKIINDSCKALSELIGNILKLNKLENQEIQSKKETYNLSEQITESILLFEENLERKSIKLIVNLDENIYLYGEKELWALVWNNLLSNAVKFTEKKGIIKVNLREEKNKICISVEDSGIGISKTEGPHIFEHFFQANTQYKNEGNGLGLTLIRRIIDITGSTIKVRSVLNKGTKFTVEIEK